MLSATGFRGCNPTIYGQEREWSGAERLGLLDELCKQLTKFEGQLEGVSIPLEWSEGRTKMETRIDTFSKRDMDKGLVWAGRYLDTIDHNLQVNCLGEAFCEHVENQAYEIANKYGFDLPKGLACKAVLDSIIRTGCVPCGVATEA